MPPTATDSKAKDVALNQVDTPPWTPSFESRRDSAEALRGVQENTNW
jgi:hypothetical protein